MHSHFIAVVDGLATVTVATNAVGTVDVVNAVYQIVSGCTVVTPFSVRYDFIYGRAHFDPEQTKSASKYTHTLHTK